MLTTLKSPLTLLFFIITITFLSCDSETNDPSGAEPYSSNKIKISGALNTEYDPPESEYRVNAKVDIRNDEKKLLISINVNKPFRNEQTSVNLIIPFESSGNLPEVGRYALTSPDDKKFSGQVSYKRFINNFNFSQYKFEGKNLSIIIENITSEYIIARFSLSADQSIGQRMTEGELENVELAYDGKINLNGIIEARIGF